MLEFVIGFLIGAVVSLGKEFLLQRYVLRGNQFFAMLLFWARILIDFAVLVAMYFYSITAMVGAAMGLSVYVVILIVQTLKKQ